MRSILRYRRTSVVWQFRKLTLVAGVARLQVVTSRLLEFLVNPATLTRFTGMATPADEVEGEVRQIRMAPRDTDGLRSQPC